MIHSIINLFISIFIAWYINIHTINAFPYKFVNRHLYVSLHQCVCELYVYVCMFCVSSCCIFNIYAEAALYTNNFRSDDADALMHQNMYSGDPINLYEKMYVLHIINNTYINRIDSYPITETITRDDVILRISN